MRNLPQFAEAIVDKISKTITLESGIVVPVGIIVLVGIFVKINKRTGWNKRIDGNYHITKYKLKTIFKSLLQIFLFESFFYLTFQ